MVKTSCCLTRQLTNHSNGRPRLSKQIKVVVTLQDGTKPYSLYWTISDAGWQFCFYFHFVMNAKYLGEKTHIDHIWQVE